MPEMLGRFIVHEAASWFPMMADVDSAQWEAFKADIGTNGIKNRIRLSADGTTLIDGRNRYLAYLEVHGHPPPDDTGPDCLYARIPADWTEEQIADWIISQNIYRRNLSADQRACIAVSRFYFGEKANGKERKAASPRNGKSHIDFVTAFRNVRKPKPDDIRTTAIIGARAKVSETKIKLTSRLYKLTVDSDDPFHRFGTELFHRVRIGKISLSAANRRFSDQQRARDQIERLKREREEGPQEPDEVTDFPVGTKPGPDDPDADKTFTPKDDWSVFINIPHLLAELERHDLAECIQDAVTKDAGEAIFTTKTSNLIKVLQNIQKIYAEAKNPTPPRNKTHRKREQL